MVLVWAGANERDLNQGGADGRNEYGPRQSAVVDHLHPPIQLPIELTKRFLSGTPGAPTQQITGPIARPQVQKSGRFGSEDLYPVAFFLDFLPSFLLEANTCFLFLSPGCIGVHWGGVEGGFGG